MSTVGADSRDRIASGRLAMGWFLASEVTVFGGMLLCFVLMRRTAGGWQEQSAHLQTSIAALNTLLLLGSGWAIARARRAAANGDRHAAGRFLLLTTLLGMEFLALKVFEWNSEIQLGFTPATDVFWSFYFTLTGFHALHVLVGVVVNACLLVASMRSRTWPQVAHRVEYAGIYWYFVDAVWLVLFALVYLG